MPKIDVLSEAGLAMPFVDSDDQACADSTDQRTSPRFTLLIRAAKLITPQGEFVCVVRDVSETGISVRLFHAMPSGSPIDLQMPTGDLYPVRHVWDRDTAAGFEFETPIDVEQIISEASEYPKRGLRLDLHFPIRISTLTQRAEALVSNLSQQGARFECNSLFAIDQSMRIETEDAIKGFTEVSAKVRWRRDNKYGVVFDDTFKLGDFARLAARLQAPTLLIE